MGALKPFEYFEPETVEAAVQILLKHGHGTGAKVLAGGVNLVPNMRKQLIQPGSVVNLNRIPGLDYIKRDETGDLRIGALSSLNSAELSPEVQKDYMVLYEAIRQLSSAQVKSIGTVVGNICIATPASDIATSLFALGAKLRIASTAAARIIPIEDFYIGVNQTILQPGEIVTEILLPSPAASTGGAFLNLVRTVDDIAKVSVAVTVTVAADKCKEAKIALGSVAPTVIRAKKAEEIIKGQKVEKSVIEAVAKAAAEEAKPITDIRSTAEYRREMTQVLTKRAIEKALERAKA